MSSEFETSLENDEVVERINLESGNFVTRGETGVMKFFLKDGRELFSLDAGLIPFENKTLLAVMQVYLLGHTQGKTQERNVLSSKLNSALQLIFE